MADDVMEQVVETATGVVLKNRQAQAVQNALAFISQTTKPPVPKAMKLAVTRGDVKRQLEAIGEVQKELIARHGTGEPGHERIQRFIDDKPALGETEAYETYMAEVEELMAQTFTLPEQSLIVLYEKGDKFSWKEDMSFEVQPSEGLADALFALLDAGLIEVREIQ